MNNLALKLDSKEERRETSQMFEPIVEGVLHFLSSRNNDLMQTCLDIVGYLINWPLHCVRKNNRKMLKHILRVVEANDVNDLNLIQACFKMIRRILKANRYFLAPSQITDVLHSIRTNLYPADWVNEPLLTLNLMINIKMMKTEIYELFDDCFGLMISVKFEAIRKLCKNICLSFIQNYPLSEQLLDKVLTRLVNNLEYSEFEGRLTVLAVLERLIEKLPIDALQNHLELLILGLLSLIVNEEVESVKTSGQKVFKDLVGKIFDDEETSSNKAGKLWESSKTLLSQPGFQRAGLALVGELFSATGQVNHPQLVSTVETALTHLEMHGEEIAAFWEQLKSDLELKEAMKENQWREIFLGEADEEDILSKMKSTKDVILGYLDFLSVVFFHEACSESFRERIYEKILPISRHPDEDVQLSIAKFIAKIMEDYPSVGMASVKETLMCIFSFIKSRHLTAEEVELYLAKSLNLITRQNASLFSVIMTAVSSINFKYLRFNTRHLSIIKKCVGCVRASFKGRQQGFAGLAEKLDAEETRLICHFFIRMLENGFLQQNRGDSLESFEEDLEEVKGFTADTDEFMKITTDVRIAIQEQKNKYKAEKKELAVNDPVEFNKKKLLEAIRRKRRRKEKITERKFGMDPQKRIKI